ncbi:MAG: MFS transporter, partial [Candidatus Dormibacteraeota bacterium]|nr:MFS transporter [Candidatus Dormibacteraeota bacterium]
MNGLGRLFGHTFDSLRIRNYRLYFAGQVVSVSGSWMQRVAQAWLVYHLSGSGLALGVVTGLQFLPVLVAGAWGGVLADRFDKRRLLLLTQTAMGLLALALGLLTISGLVQLWMVYLLALALGVVTASDNPARQAFVMELVGRSHVMNAVSLNSAVFTLARIVGPAVAGLLINAVGTGWCFLVNALSFGGVLVALAAMRRQELLPWEPSDRSRGGVLEGLRYAWSSLDLRVPLLLMAVVGTLALNFSVILPLMASQTFHGDAGTYGLLFSTLGVGSLLGALITAGRREPSRRLLLLSLLAFGLFMLAAAVAPSLWLELAMLVPLGVAAVIFQATSNSTLQVKTDPALRGRVMALYSVVFMGTTPIGAPIVGLVSQAAGPRAGLALGGAAVLLTVAAFGLWSARRARRGEGQLPAEDEDRAGIA